MEEDKEQDVVTATVDGVPAEGSQLAVAEAEDLASAIAEGRARARRVAAIGFFLLILLGLLFLLSKPPTPAPSAQDLSAELMPTGIPAGFEIKSASALPTGETVLTLVNPDPGGEGPEELLFVRYSSNSSAEADMNGNKPTRSPGAKGEKGEKLPDDPSMALDKWRDQPDFAMHLTVETGQVLWGGWRAARATERSLRADGTWRESVRVNLSQSNRFLILFAQWPVGKSANADQLEPILRQVAMVTSIN
ncbi:MAG: hypothetical protein ACI82F_003497 [Planctomycetota bacterium]|jgi:hypothetical protein